MGLTFLWLQQSLERAPSSGVVWSNCCMLGWAGHLSLSQATFPWGRFGCMLCLDHQTWPKQDKFQWVLCAPDQGSMPQVSMLYLSCARQEVWKRQQAL